MNYGDRWKGFFELDTAESPIEGKRASYRQLRDEKFACKIDQMGGFDPLSMETGQDNKWNTFYQDEELLSEISIDLKRLYPKAKEFFFQNENYLSKLSNVLFVWCKLHPDVSYRQGMHDLVAVLFYALVIQHTVDLPHQMGGSGKIQKVRQDGVLIAVLDSTYQTTTPQAYISSVRFEDSPIEIPCIEEDCFLLFEKLMVFMQPLFAISSVQSHGTDVVADGSTEVSTNVKLFQEDNDQPSISSGIGGKNGVLSELQQMCTLVQNDLLVKYDPQLSYHLLNEEIIPETYLLRWIRLLFAREFELDDLLIVWDALFSYDSFIGDENLLCEANCSNRFGPPLLKYVCVAMLLNLSPILTKSDNTECLQNLMHISRDIDPVELVRTALYLNNPLLQENENSNISVVKFEEGSLGIVLTAASHPYSGFLAVREFSNSGGKISVAKCSGKVELGDIIVAINGTKLSSMTTDDIKKHINYVGKPVYISFEHVGRQSIAEMNENPNQQRSENTLTQGLSASSILLHLLPGEMCFANLSASLEQNNSNGYSGCQYIAGKMFLTNYRVLFHKLTNNDISWQIPILSISSIHGIDIGNDETINSNSKIAFQVVLECKDTQVATFLFSNYAEYGRMLKCLNCLAFPQNLLNAFCFSYNPILTPAEKNSLIFDIRDDYKRLGIYSNPSFRCINQKYELCDSYPEYLMVPSGMSDESLKKAASFRSKNRIPVIVYLNKETGSVICRSSQPLVGFKSSRCLEDEELVRLLCLSTNNKNLMQYTILDARGQLAAVGNKAMGKGTEIPTNYNHAKLRFMNIDNIHSIRQSFQLMAGIFQIDHSGKGKSPSSTNPIDGLSESSSFFSRVDNSGWLKHIRSIMQASIQLAHLVHVGESVLTHCSDGWDRTAQMVSIAELVLDPFYRTLKGFEVLIEKEWCCFGHQFSLRSGHGRSDISNEQRSPIFIVWLDCIWQILRQYPSDFQFNEKVLLALADHVYSCKYGNFLFNTEMDRKKYFSKRRMTSIWSDIYAHSDLFINQMYSPRNIPIYPSCNSKNIRVWEEYFCRWDQTVIPPVPSFQFY